MTTTTYAALRALQPPSTGSESMSFRSLVRRLGDEDPLTIPDYQRGHVWTEEQQARFIGFLAEGGEAPPIFVQRWPLEANLPDELIDGLQRVTAVVRFMRNEVPMELADGTRMFLRDFSESDQHFLTGYGGPRMEIRYVQLPTRAEVLHFYLRLNRGGTPHSDDEIKRVRAMLAQERAR